MEWQDITYRNLNFYCIVILSIRKHLFVWILSNFNTVISVFPSPRICKKVCSGLLKLHSHNAWNKNIPLYSTRDCLANSHNTSHPSVNLTQCHTPYWKAHISQCVTQTPVTFLIQSGASFVRTVGSVGGQEVQR